MEFGRESPRAKNWPKRQEIKTEEKQEKGGCSKWGGFAIVLATTKRFYGVNVESLPMSKQFARLTVQMEWCASSEKSLCADLFKKILTSLRTRAKNLDFIFELRIWSWFRLNAGGVDETCKSNEKGSNLLLVAKGLVMYEQSAFYLGITTGNGR